MRRAIALTLTALDAAIAVAACVVVLASEDMTVIVGGDVAMCVACLLAVPLLHYWIEEADDAR